MPGIALTTIVDMNSDADSLPASEARALHRRIRDFVPDILEPSGYRGEGDRAAALFSRHTAAKARIVIRLLSLNMGAKAFKDLLRQSDGHYAPNELRYASGLDNAIAAVLAGRRCEVRYELVNGSGRVRARFIYDGQPENERAARIIGAPVITLTLRLNELLAPILDKLPPADDADDAAPAPASEPHVTSRADEAHILPAPPADGND